MKKYILALLFLTASAFADNYMDEALSKGNMLLANNTQAQAQETAVAVDNTKPTVADSTVKEPHVMPKPNKKTKKIANKKHKSAKAKAHAKSKHVKAHKKTASKKHVKKQTHKKA